MPDVQIITSANDLDWDKSYHISAGPGAGKTHILVEHISNVVTKGKYCLGTNGKIACITYTNIAVETINKRLSDTADRVDVCTIHSFLFKNVVKPYLWILKDGPKYEIKQIGDIEPWETRAPNDLFKQWARGSRGLNLLQIDANKRINALQALKTIYWTLSEDRKEELIVPKNHQWALVKDAKEQDKLIAWKSLLYSKGYMSYDDILYFAWRIYRQTSALIRFISKKYPFIFVDEFQDTTPFQAELIDALKTEGNSTVLVIGDSHQSIFGFAGAKKERFDNYQNNADINPVIVNDNWRSSQKIVFFLNRIRQDGIDQKPTSANKSKDFHAPVILLKGSAKDTKSKFFKLCDKYGILNDNKSRVILCRYENIKNYNYSWTKLFKFDEYAMEDPWDKFADNYRSNMFQRLIEAQQFYKKGDLINAHKRIESGIRALRKQTSKGLPPYLPRGQEKRALYTKTLLWLNNNLADEERTVADFYNSFIEWTKKLFAIGNKRVGEWRKAYKYNEMPIEQLVSTHCDKELGDEIQTIHKAKGTEYDAVLAVIPNKIQTKRGIDCWLLNPEDDEESRLGYVACSRAKKLLCLAVENLEDGDIKKLQNKFENTIEFAC